MTQQVVIKNQEFVLHPLGGLFWEAQSLLLVSDVHLGKIVHFRKSGAAIPQKGLHKNFMLLNQLTGYFKPFHICFLGDLFHSYYNNEWRFFENWVADTPSRISLVVGNHDVISHEKFEDLGIDCFPELIVEGFLLTHNPEVREGLFTFCGHVHPAIMLRGFGRQRLKLPCFFKTQEQLILPAFGEFTGTHTLKAKPEDEVFVIADGEVIKV